MSSEDEADALLAIWLDPDMAIEALLEDGTTRRVLMQHGETLVRWWHLSTLTREEEIQIAVKIIKIPEGVIGFDEEGTYLPLFREFPNLKRVHLPSTLERLGVELFEYCLNLETVNIPPNVSVIPDSCFEECRKLRHIVLPENLLEIQNDAFFHAGLKTIDIPPMVSKIGETAFYNCLKLKRVSFAASDACKLDTIGYGAFWNTDVRRVRIPPSVTRIGRYAFCTTEGHGRRGLGVVYFEGPRTELASLFNPDDPRIRRARVKPAIPRGMTEAELQRLLQKRFSSTVELVLCDNPEAFGDDDVKRLQFPNVRRENYGVRIPPGFETLWRRLYNMGLLDFLERSGAQALKDASYRDMTAYLAEGRVRDAAIPNEIAEHILDQRPSVLWFDI